ncbi:MAG TPA: ACP S-malonyltransferase [Bacteroidota bacterium]|nr:ACP S-malonyltransferase [Bacteroidota bacterium]
MAKVAYIFPGQGSQYVGMGKDLAEQSAAARAIFMQADEILGVPLSKICFDGPEQELRQTKNTQPAIFLHSMVLLQMMEQRDAQMAAGHSLGEYSALVAAGAMTFEDALRLVRLRGELMQRAGEEQKGTMAAIVGLAPEIVAAVCSAASAAGIVQPANFNSPGQIVISGSVPGVQKAVELAKAKGAKLARELPVSGAFHSPLMQSAKDRLREKIGATPVRDAVFPVYSNVTARKVQKAEEIRTLLLQQLTSAVQWEESMRAMIADGAATFVEIGPGKVLQGLLKRIDSSVQVIGIDTFNDVEKLAHV